MRMYISPFVAGIAVTLIAEYVALVVYSVIRKNAEK